MLILYPVRGIFHDIGWSYSGRLDEALRLFAAHGPDADR
jgi:hypothetical protein